MLLPVAALALCPWREDGTALHLAAAAKCIPQRAGPLSFVKWAFHPGLKLANAASVQRFAGCFAGDKRIS
jgi:hypothetical protein